MKNRGSLLAKIALALLFLLILWVRFGRVSPLDRCEAEIDRSGAATAEARETYPLVDRMQAALDEVRGTGRDWRSASVYYSTGQARREGIVIDRALEKANEANEAMERACGAALLQLERGETPE